MSPDPASCFGGALRTLRLPPHLDAAALERLHRELDVPGAVVLRGAAGVFCRGMALDPAVEPPLRSFAALLERLGARLSVALLEGEALGGGLGLSSACQVVLATPDARLGLPEALIGLLPAVVLPWIARRAGPAAALRLALTTQPLEAQAGLRLGLIDEVSAQPEQALDALERRWRCADPRALSTLLSLGAAWAPDPTWLSAALPAGEALAASAESRRRVARLAAGDPPWTAEDEEDGSW